MKQKIARQINVSVATKKTASASSVQISIDRTSVFGNPFTIKEAGSRDQAVSLYKKYLWQALHTEKPTESQTVLRDAMRSLVRCAWSNAEISLICHCAPKACHGDVIVSMLHWAVNKSAPKAS